MRDPLKLNALPDHDIGQGRPINLAALPAIPETESLRRWRKAKRLRKVATALRDRVGKVSGNTVSRPTIADLERVITIIGGAINGGPEQLVAILALRLEHLELAEKIRDKEDKIRQAKLEGALLREKLGLPPESP